MFPQSSPPKTVDYVDLSKYTGQWYEIAKIPNSFQDHCIKGTTAKYTVKKNGEIAVINSCIDEMERLMTLRVLQELLIKNRMQSWK